jgi:hypothetical protein
LPRLAQLFQVLLQLKNQKLMIFTLNLFTGMPHPYYRSPVPSDVWTTDPLIPYSAVSLDTMSLSEIKKHLELNN